MGVFKAFHILLIVGGILVLAALPLLVSSLTTSAAATTTIPAGPWRMSYYFNLLGSGTLRGNFQETTGGSLNLFVLTEAQYSAYQSGADGGSLLSVLSSRGGSFGVALPGSGTYYLVADHATDSFAIAQEIQFVVQVRGINPTTFVVGAGLFTAGVALFLWGTWRRRTRPWQRFPVPSAEPPSGEPPAGLP